MTSILSAIFPVMLIILIGYLTGLTLPLQSQTLSQLILYILTPALIIDSFYRTNISIESAVGLPFGFILTSILIYIQVVIIAKLTKLSLSKKKAFIATILFPNNGNMGLSVVIFALGDAGLKIAILYMICSSILMFCVGPMMLQRKKFIHNLKIVFKLPLAWSILIGIAWRLSSIKIPFQLDTSIQKIGEAAIPIALIFLGIQLAKTNFEFGIQELLSVFMRLLIAPLIAYIVGISLRLNILDLQVLVIQSAMPTAVNSLVLITEFGGDTNFVARTITMSTIMSFFTLPIVLWLLSLNT